MAARLALTLAALCAVCALAARVTVEPDATLPDDAIARRLVAPGWRRVGRAAPADLVTLTFAVRLDNVDRAMNELFTRADPGSGALYRQWLSRDEVVALTVSTARVDAVADWVRAEFPDALVVSEGAGGTFIAARGVPVAAAERALSAQFFRYTHAPSGRSVLRSASLYSLPAELASEIDFVAGVHRLPNVPSPRASPVSPSAGLVVDPRLIREKYEIGSFKGDGKSSSQAVAQFLGQRCGLGDLDEFRTLFAQWAFGITPTFVGPDRGLPGTEACLDLETIVGVGAHVPTVFWSTPGLDESQEPFLVWTANVSSDPSPPNLFSVSYGDVEASLSTAYMERVSTELGLLGVRGVTILFASGDSGVGCADNKFEPNFPASAPTVTTVGGTALGLLESGPEVCNGLSGGGFSNVFPLQPYQQNAVAAYLRNNATIVPPSKYYNVSGRAYPDISALSSGFIIVVDGVPLPGVAGTSCASPTSAAVFSLINNVLMAKGEPSLGFVNPLIYSTLGGTQAFFDVVQGGNPPQGGGCGGHCFFATDGWDACSGMGAPRFAGIASVLGI